MSLDKLQNSGLYSRSLSFFQDAARSLVIRALQAALASSADLIHVAEPTRDRTGSTGSLILGKQTPGKDSIVSYLTVLDQFFWVRVLFSWDMGFAQSFMLNEISSPDLTTLFEVCIRGASSSAAPTATYGLGRILDGLRRGMANTIETSKLNAAAHYSLSNDMFAAFLSDDMTYSAPLWLNKDQPDTLEKAQLRKLRYAMEEARIRDGDRVLEIGTGWGSFALYAVQHAQCQVVTVTASTEQKELAEERIAAAGMSDRIEVLLCDYRELPAGYWADQPFDKIVSIEMIEHVGRGYLDTYFEHMNKYLKKDGGIGYFQCITIPEARYEAYAKRGEDFISKYIFPGGHLPTVSGLVASIDRGSKGTLVVEGVKSFSGHYVKALRLWREKFEHNFDHNIAPALREKASNISTADLDIFRRKWEYYFRYCEAGFKTKTLGDVGITVAREGCIAVIDDIPM